VPLFARYFGLAANAETLRDTLTYSEFEQFKSWARIFAQADGINLTM